MTRFDLDQVFEARTVAKDGIDHIDKDLTTDHHRGIGVINDKGRFGRGKAPSDRGQTGAGLGRSHPIGKELIIILGHTGDPVARLDACGDQGMSAAIRRFIQLGIGRGAAFKP